MPHTHISSQDQSWSMCVVVVRLPCLVPLVIDSSRPVSGAYPHRSASEACFQGCSLSASEHCLPAFQVSSARSQASFAVDIPVASPFVSCSKCQTLFLSSSQDFHLRQVPIPCQRLSARLSPMPLSFSQVFGSPRSCPSPRSFFSSFPRQSSRSSRAVLCCSQCCAECPCCCPLST